MRRLAQPARHHAPRDQREAAPPVVSRRGEVPVRPPRRPVGLGEVAQLGGGERLDRAQRADRPGLADPLAERQEDPGQPAWLGAAGRRAAARRRWCRAARPGRTGRCSSAKSRAARPSTASAPAKSPRVVVTQARFCSDHACPRGSPAATLIWYDDGEPAAGLAEPPADEVGHAQAPQRGGPQRRHVRPRRRPAAPPARPVWRRSRSPSVWCDWPQTSSAAARVAGSSPALATIFSARASASAARPTWSSARAWTSRSAAGSASPARAAARSAYSTAAVGSPSDMARRAARPSAATPQRRDRAGRGVRAQPDGVGEGGGAFDMGGDELVPVRLGRAGRRGAATVRGGPAGQRRVPFGQVGLADSGVRGLPHQRGGEGVTVAGAVQHPPLQQLLDGAFELDRGHRRGPAVPAAPPVAQRLERAGGHRVADDGGVAQHRAGVGGQCVDARGEHRRQVAGEQPAAERPGHQPPAAGGGRRAARARRLSFRDGGQGAALDQQGDQFGQVERRCPGRWRSSRSASACGSRPPPR